VVAAAFLPTAIELEIPVTSPLVNLAETLPAAPPSPARAAEPETTNAAAAKKLPATNLIEFFMIFPLFGVSDWKLQLPDLPQMI
jgi:hypothetical protein